MINECSQRMVEASRQTKRLPEIPSAWYHFPVSTNIPGQYPIGRRLFYICWGCEKTQPAWLLHTLVSKVNEAYSLGRTSIVGLVKILFNSSNATFLSPSKSNFACCLFYNNSFKDVAIPCVKFSTPSGVMCCIDPKKSAAQSCLSGILMCGWLFALCRHV